MAADSSSAEEASFAEPVVGPSEVFLEASAASPVVLVQFVAVSYLAHPETVVGGRTSVLVEIAHIEVADVESTVLYIVQEVGRRLCLVQVLVPEAVSAQLYMVGVLEVWSLRPQTVVVAVVTKTSGSMFPSLPHCTPLLSQSVQPIRIER